MRCQSTRLCHVACRPTYLLTIAVDLFAILLVGQLGPYSAVVFAAVPAFGLLQLGFRPLCPPAGVCKTSEVDDFPHRTPVTAYNSQVHRLALPSALFPRFRSPSACLGQTVQCARRFAAMITDDCSGNARIRSPCHRALKGEGPAQEVCTSVVSSGCSRRHCRTRFDSVAYLRRVRCAP